MNTTINAELRESFAAQDIALEDHIGSGSFAEVYAGTYQGRRAAIKIIRGSAATNNGFVQEYGHALRASSEHVVRVYDAGIVADRPFIAMEYGGKTLTHFLSTEPGDYQTSISQCRQMAAGVRDLHRAGVTHRDIKPDNVLVGQNGLVKLTDLGLGVHTETPLISNGFAGNLAYAAPEQIRGKVSPAIDVYSVGVLLHKLLTGRLPYTQRETDTSEEGFQEAVYVLGDLLEGKNNPQLALPPAMHTPELEALILGCVSPDPSLRPSAEVLYYDLTQLEQEQPTTHTTLLNEELLHGGTPVDPSMLSTWKAIEVEIPDEHATEDTTALTFSPKKATATALFDTLPLTVRTRVTAQVELPNNGMRGYLAFAFHAEDYGISSANDAFYSDVFGIRTLGNGHARIEYRKHGRVRQSRTIPLGDTLEHLVIEQYPQRKFLSWGTHQLRIDHAHTPPAKRRELLISSSIPATLHNFGMSVEQAGERPHRLHDLEKLFAAGRYDGATALAEVLIHELPPGHELLDPVLLLLAKSHVHEQLLHPEDTLPEDGQIEGALTMLGSLEGSTNPDVSLDAGREIANVQFFLQDQEGAALEQLQYLLSQGKDASALAAQARWLARHASEEYKLQFRGFSKQN